jgi:adenylate cyclase
MGPLRLLRSINACLCGAPFDLEATPDFAARIEAAELLWSPPSPVDWPLKDG